MSEQAYFAAHMEDLRRRAAKTGCAWSRFLTPAEQARLPAGRDGDVELTLFGGMEGAERRIAVFRQVSRGVFEPEDALHAICIRHRREDALTHRDVLGALMHQGIERGVVGDICCLEGCAWLVCMADMSGYLTQQVTQIAHVGVRLERQPLSALPARTEALDEQTDTVASLRLDAVTAAVYKLSRAAAAEAITAGLLQVDHQINDNPARPLKPGALLSLRGHGRVRLLEILGETKKGRLRIKYGRYTG